MNEIPVPPSVCCPKCGKRMKLERITDIKTLHKLEETNYAAGAKGACDCGIIAILAIKRMPDNPTFTLMFNVYKLEGE